MSPGSNRLAILQAIDVALNPCTERHSKERMSLGIGTKRDIRVFACRSGSARSATSESLHVARDRRGVRHGGASMSPEPRVPCDMGHDACRSTRSPRATWGTMHVARPERASVDPWPCGATCSTAHVASCDCGVRHGRAGMTMHRRGSGDIPSCEPIAPACWPASPWRSSASALGAGACALGRSSSAHSLKEPAPSDSSPSTRPPVSEELSGLLASR